MTTERVKNEHYACHSPMGNWSAHLSQKIKVSNALNIWKRVELTRASHGCDSSDVRCGSREGSASR